MNMKYYEEKLRNWQKDGKNINTKQINKALRKVLNQT